VFSRESLELASRTAGHAGVVLQEADMRIVLILLLTALAILVARLAHNAPVIQTRVGQLVSVIRAPAPLSLTPTLVYAGVRG
jgi:hypothetical protein